MFESTGTGVELSFEAVLSYAALGMIAGFGYYLSMRMGVLPAGSGMPRWVGGALTVLRVAAAIAFFAWLASLGALPILSAFAGFLVGRVIAFRLTGEDA